jgi:hypothetical protein
MTNDIKDKDPKKDTTVSSKDEVSKPTNLKQNQPVAPVSKPTEQATQVL